MRPSILIIQQAAKGKPLLPAQGWWHLQKEQSIDGGHLPSTPWVPGESRVHKRVVTSVVNILSWCWSICRPRSAVAVLPEAVPGTDGKSSTPVAKSNAPADQRRIHANPPLLVPLGKFSSGGLDTLCPMWSAAQLGTKSVSFRYVETTVLLLPTVLRWSLELSVRYGNHVFVVGMDHSNIVKGGYSNSEPESAETFQSLKLLFLAADSGGFGWWHRSRESASVTWSSEQTAACQQDLLRRTPPAAQLSPEMYHCGA